MHGIVNFMEARRFRDMFQTEMMDADSNISLSDSHHDGNANFSQSIQSIQGAGFSQVTGIVPSTIMGPSVSNGGAGSSNQIPQPANTSLGKPANNHMGNMGLASSGSRAHLPRFGPQHVGGGTSMMHMQSMLGGLSTMNSALGGFNNSTGQQQQDDHREVKAFVLCNDTAALAGLCASLWKHRVPVVAISDARDFAPIALRARHDRMRLLFVYSQMITETVYSSLRPMEEQYPQQIVYFSSAAHALLRSDVVPKHLITYDVKDEDVTRFITLAQDAAGNVATVTHDIMRTGKHFTIPHYSLGRRLGGGAFGNVFEAEIESLGGRCAVKRIYFKSGESAERLREIGREVDIMSRLQHPNIVQYLFCRREGNCICIFMELCEGGSLAGEIQKRAMTPDAIKHHLRQVIEAVMYLHENSIIHRDLKPENVLFRNGQVKLSDFGTAAKFQKDEHQQHMKGTFPFMAPEVLLEEPYGVQCDVWSIGCIAADMLGITLEHRSLGMIQLTEFFKGLSMMMAIEVDAEEPSLKDFIERCFCRDPLRRPNPQALLQHALLKPDDSSIRKHMEHSRNRPMRRPSLGVVSLRSMGLGGPGHDNESEF
jgi:predicted Ser/Thr protein kinase